MCKYELVNHPPPSKPSPDLIFKNICVLCMKLCTSNPSLECSCRYVILTPVSSLKRFDLLPLLISCLECNISSLPFNFFVSILEILIHLITCSNSVLEYFIYLPRESNREHKYYTCTKKCRINM